VNPLLQTVLPYKRRGNFLMQLHNNRNRFGLPFYLGAILLSFFLSLFPDSPPLPFQELFLGEYPFLYNSLNEECNQYQAPLILHHRLNILAGQGLVDSSYRSELGCQIVPSFDDLP